MKKSENKLNSFLNNLLADEVVFAMNVRNAHWNLVSYHFVPVHEWLGKVYTEINESIDEIAERNRMIRGAVDASLSSMLKSSQVKEHNGILTDENEINGKLYKDNTIIIEKIKSGILLAEKIGDNGTEDFLTSKLQQHEKLDWVLRSALLKS